MTVRIVPVDPASPATAAIEEAASMLRAGQIVAFPTETVYGLGANALDAEAIQRVYEAKGRPAGNPLIVHVARIEDAQAVTAQWPAAAQRLVETFWPGPLTLVLEKAEHVPDVVTSGLPTVAVRMPAHPVARALIQQCGFPLAAPSANQYTGVSPTRAEHVAMALGDKIPLVLDAGQTDVGIESTVVKIESDHVTLLRPGMISAQEIEAVAQVPVRRVAAIVADSDARSSPGMSAKHYAPRHGRVIVGGPEAIAELPRATRGLAIMFRDRQLPAPVTYIAAPEDPDQYAHDLYSWLHRAEEEACVFIFFEEPPDAPKWEGIRDRLRRAAQV